MIAGTQEKQIPPGYKLTQVGVIPEDWGTYSLKQITLDMLQGVNTAIDKPEYVQDGIPMLKANNVIDGEVVFEGADHISRKTFSDYSDRFKAKKNDFLFSNIGARLGTGSLLKVNVECSFAWNVMRIVPDTQKITPEYLCFLINSPKYSQDIKSKQSGSGMGFVPKGVMRDLVFGLPKRLEEQTTIAAVLSDTDALIKCLEKLIAKKRAVEQGAMQELLTGKSRLPGFSGKWEVKLLAQVCDLQTGRRPKGGVTEEGDVPSLGGENIYNENGLDLSTVKKVSESFFAGMHKGVLKERDVLINKDGANTGKLAIYINSGFPRACVNEHLFIMRGKDGVDNGFLYYALSLKSSRREISKQIASSAQPGLNRGFVNVVSIRIPDPAQQTAIASVLSDMDSEIEALEQKLSKYKQLKQGMMQVLLTGNIRLPH